LLKLLHVCPVYCRFCFRRETVGPGGPTALSPEAVATALDYIRARPAIWEVILTGGDPMVLSARRLRAVVRELAAIEHVKIIRVHTREFEVNGYTHHASPDDPQYEIKSSKTDHIAFHRGAALTRLGD